MCMIGISFMHVGLSIIHGRKLGRNIYSYLFPLENKLMTTSLQSPRCALPSSSSSRTRSRLASVAPPLPSLQHGPASPTTWLNFTITSLPRVICVSFAGWLSTSYKSSPSSFLIYMLVYMACDLNQNLLLIESSFCSVWGMHGFASIYSFFISHFPFCADLHRG